MPSKLRYRTVTCNSCAVLVINNHICHEHGCPEAYKDEIRECKWCSSKFNPEEKYQRCCSPECDELYNG